MHPYSDSPKHTERVRCFIFGKLWVKITARSILMQRFLWFYSVPPDECRDEGKGIGKR
jgi:hypothetical protein